MKIKSGFKLRKLGKEFILVPEGLERVDFNKMVAMNATAAYLWESVQDRDFDVSEIERLILEKYEVEQSVAAADAAKVLNQWVDAGLCE